MSLFEFIILECGAAAVAGGIEAAKGSSGAIRIKLYLIAVCIGIGNSYMVYFFGGMYGRRILLNEKCRAKYKAKPRFVGLYIIVGIWVFISAFLGGYVIKQFH